MATTLTEFLLARIAEDEAAARLCFPTDQRWVMLAGMQGAGMSGHAVLAECEAKRRIVEWHKSWPVLVATEPKLEPASGDLDRVSYQMVQQINWLTSQEYVKRFGEEAPTMPMLSAMAAVYSDHPDYQEEWAQ